MYSIHYLLAGGSVAMQAVPLAIFQLPAAHWCMMLLRAGHYVAQQVVLFFTNCLADATPAKMEATVTAPARHS